MRAATAKLKGTRAVASHLLRSLLIAVSFVAVSKPAFAADKPQVTLVGAIHEMHIEDRWSYSLEDLWGTVRSYKPDLICGEITPEAFGTDLEGVFPPEAAMLAVLAPSVGARFEPVDWRADYVAHRAAEEAMSASKTAILDAAGQAFSSDLFAAEGRIFEHVHGEEFQLAAEGVHRLDAWLGGPLADGEWEKRNGIAAERCLAATTPDTQHIVIVFGAEHLFGLRAALREAGLSATIANEKKSASLPLVDAITARWERNRDALARLKSTQRQLDPSYALRVEESGRVASLSRFVDVFKAATSP